jgi:hypothetical protein
MHPVKNFLYALFLTACTVQVAAQSANTNTPPELASRYERLEVRYTVNADATYTRRTLTQIKALNKNGLEDLKRTYFSYTPSVQVGRVLAAYTLKASRQRVEVPPDSFQVTTRGGGSR